MRPLTASTLRQRIDIVRLVETADGKGGFTYAASTIAARVPAEVTALDGRESVMEHVLQGISTYRIRIRWRGDLKASDQVKIEGMDLNIKAPPSDPDGRRVQLVILADTAAPLAT